MQGQYSFSARAIGNNRLMTTIDLRQE